MAAFVTRRPFAGSVLDPDEVKRLQRYLATKEKERPSTVMGLQNRVGVLARSSAGKWLSSGPDGEALDLLEAVQKGMVVLFSLNSSKYPDLAPHVASLVLLDLTTVAGELTAHREIRRRVSVVLDELSALDKDRLINLLARGRGASISLVVSTQDPADLERIGRSFLDQVLANTAVKVVHRLGGRASATRLAEAAGTTVEWEESVEVDRPTSLLAWSSVAATGRGTFRLAEKLTVEPDLIQELSCGEAVVIRTIPDVRAHLVRIAPAPIAKTGANRRTMAPAGKPRPR
jgi:hypothetical protein